MSLDRFKISAVKRTGQLIIPSHSGMTHAAFRSVAFTTSRVGRRWPNFAIDLSDTDRIKCHVDRLLLQDSDCLMLNERRSWIL